MTQDYAQTVKVWVEKEVMKIDLTYNYAEMEIEFSSFIQFLNLFSGSRKYLNPTRDRFDSNSWELKKIYFKKSPETACKAKMKFGRSKVKSWKKPFEGGVYGT